MGLSPTSTPSGTLDPRDIFDLSRESVIVRDAEGRVTAWNVAAQRLFGWSAQEMIGEHADTMLASRPRAVRLLGPQEDQAEPWTMITARARKDGRMVLIDARFTPRFSDDGAFAYLVETGRQIVYDGPGLPEIPREEYSYWNLFHTMPMPFFELDLIGGLKILTDIQASGVRDLREHLLASPDLVRDILRAVRIVDLNRAAIETFGGEEREEMMGSIEPYWPRESYAVYVESVMARMEGSVRFSKEVVMRALDGSTFDCLLTTCLNPDLLAQGRLIVGLQDISKLKNAARILEQSREHYRAVFEHMPIALCRLNNEALGDIYSEIKEKYGMLAADQLADHPEVVAKVGEAVFIEDANQRAAQILGASSAADLIGRPIGPYWVKRPETLHRAIAAAVHRTPFEEETQIVTQNGDVVDILFSIAFVSEQLGRFSVIGLVDISERLAVQEALESARTDFAHAVRLSMLGELTASITHEVSQPLAAITISGQAGLQWLDRAEPKLDETKLMLNRVIKHAARASSVVARVRSLATGAAPKRQKIDLSAILQGSAVLLEPEARRLRVSLRFDLPVHACLIWADRTEIEQVIVNLALNAMQAIEGHDPETRAITVALRERVQDFEVTVADTGPGLEEDLIDRLFDSFFTTKGDGVGLGLSVCRSIVQSLGGRIAASNSADLPGAQFTFTLPRARTNESIDPGMGVPPQP